MSSNPKLVTRVLLLAGSLIVALGGAGLTWRRHVAHGKWQEALVGIEQLEERLNSRVVERVALWGETNEGQAQPYYDRALAAVEEWDAQAVMSISSETGEEGQAARRKLLHEGAGALADLHRGAHALDATHRVDWSRGFQIPMRTLLYVRVLTHISEMQAYELIEEGQDLEAVRVLLDAMQFAADQAGAPILIEEMIGLAELLPDILSDGLADGSLMDLSPGAREELNAGVEIMNRRLGWRVASMEGELLLGVRGLEHVFKDGWTDSMERMMGQSIHPLQRLVLRDYAAEYVKFMASACQRVDAAHEMGLAHLARELNDLDNEAELFRNPIVAVLVPSLVSAYRSRLYSVGRLRLFLQALSGADHSVDPWLNTYLRRQPTETGERLWMDHELFGKLEVLVTH